jgi:hypothetical protein
MRVMKAVGIILALLMALVLLYQASQNGRYHPMPVGGGGAFLIMDTRTGAWHLDVPSQQDVDAAKRRSAQ